MIRRRALLDAERCWTQSVVRRRALLDLAYVVWLARWIVRVVGACFCWLYWGIGRERCVLQVKGLGCCGMRERANGADASCVSGV